MSVKRTHRQDKGEWRAEPVAKGSGGKSYCVHEAAQSFGHCRFLEQLQATPAPRCSTWRGWPSFDTRLCPRCNYDIARYRYRASILIQFDTKPSNMVRTIKRKICRRLHNTGFRKQFRGLVNSTLNIDFTRKVRRDSGSSFPKNFIPEPHCLRKRRKSTTLQRPTFCIEFQ